MSDSNNRISLLSATMLSVTCMVGSGWLFSSQLSAKQAGNWAFLAWILAATLVLLVGFCFAKVASLYPVRGGSTRISSITHNNVYSMPFAFANWFAIMVTIATEAQATTQYLAAFDKSNFIMSDNMLTFYGRLIALAILFIYLAVNFYGVKLLAKVNDTITIIKIAVPIFVVIVLLAVGFSQGSSFANFSSDVPNNNQFNIGSSLTAMLGAGLIYTFNGFQTVISYGSELRNPKKNLFLAVILSVLIVLGLYLILQWAFMSAIPHDYLIKIGGWSNLNFESPLINLAMLLGLNFIVVILLATSVVSPSATGYTYLGSCSRMLYAMAAEGQVPRWIAKLCPKYNISRRSLIINFLIVAVALWNANNWHDLMIVVTAFQIISYMAAPISMGAAIQKNRIFGAIVFIILGLLLLDVNRFGLFMMNICISAIMLLYAILQSKRLGISNVLILIMPAVIYFWLIYAFYSFWLVLIISLVFYVISTNSKYIAFCHNTKDERNSIVD